MKQQNNQNKHILWAVTKSCAIDLKTNKIYNLLYILISVILLNVNHLDKIYASFVVIIAKIEFETNIQIFFDHNILNILK